jgi:hypothetical protein
VLIDKKLKEVPQHRLRLGRWMVFFVGWSGVKVARGSADKSVTTGHQESSLIGALCPSFGVGCNAASTGLGPNEWKGVDCELGSLGPKERKDLAIIVHRKPEHNVAGGLEQLVPTFYECFHKCPECLCAVVVLGVSTLVATLLTFEHSNPVGEVAMEEVELWARIGECPGVEVGF